MSTYSRPVCVERCTQCFAEPLELCDVTKTVGQNLGNVRGQMKGEGEVNGDSQLGLTGTGQVQVDSWQTARVQLVHVETHVPSKEQ